MTDDARITILEEKLAYQEHTIQSLSDGLYRQQTVIDRLETQLQTLAEQLRTLSEAARITPEGNERPPHY
jgi:SlyX protein